MASAWLHLPTVNVGGGWKGETSKWKQDRAWRRLTLLPPSKKTHNPEDTLKVKLVLRRDFVIGTAWSVAAPAEECGDALSALTG